MIFLQHSTIIYLEGIEHSFIMYSGNFALGFDSLASILTRKYKDQNISLMGSIIQIVRAHLW